MMVYKINESIIVIQAEAINPIQTGVVFWSHDRGTAKLRFKLQKDGINQNLPEGTTVPIRLMFKSSTAQGGYGKHDYLATIEDRLNGIVSIILEDNILGYQGRVDGSIYIDFPNDQSLDTAGRFSFSIRRSPIDDTTPELEDYYFNGFSQTIDKIEKMIADAKAEIDEKVAASSTEIDGKLKDTNDKITKANQDVATINSNIDKANNRIDQTNQKIGDLGKLKKMYANSIDFGDYDYSGNPNLMLNTDFSKLSKDSMATAIVNPGSQVIDKGDYFEIDTTSVTGDFIFYIPNTPRLITGKRYNVSLEMRTETGTFTNIKIRPVYHNAGGAVAALFDTVSNTATEEWTRYNITSGIVPAEAAQSRLSAIQFYLPSTATRGKLYVRYNIKIEEGSTVSPYQPNLLEAPYYLRKSLLNENLIDSVSYSNSNYLIGSFAIKKPISNGEKVTFMLKGTKLSTKSFGLYIQATTGAGNEFQGHLTAVEGLVDTWSWTGDVKISGTTTETGKVIIYQLPPSAQVADGPATIEWAKLEKGDTATPNISMFKYFGEGLKDSNNPTDYSWDITPEYAEKTMGNAVSLTDPQSVEGLKNFKDGLQVGGKNVATEIEDTGWLDLTPASGYSWNIPAQVRRIGKDICFRGALNSTTVLGDVSTLPTKLSLEPSGEMQFDLPCKTSDVTQRARVYIRPNGTIGLVGVSGNSPIFLSGIRYFVD